MNDLLRASHDWTVLGKRVVDVVRKMEMQVQELNQAIHDAAREPRPPLTLRSPRESFATETREVVAEAWHVVPDRTAHDALCHGMLWDSLVNSRCLRSSSAAAPR